MKKYIFLAVSALTLASCSSDDFLGDTLGNNPSYAQKAISFGGTTGKISRATEKTDGAAAEALGNNFIVFGTKTKEDNTTQTVFNKYTVSYNATNKWTYDNAKGQSIKYWDYSATKYDFYALSLAGKTITVEKNEGEANPSVTLKGNVEDLQACFIAAPVTVEPAKYGEDVQFIFSSTGTKVSVGIYETILGYSIKNIKFYKSDGTTKVDHPVLYATSPCFSSSTGTGTLKITFGTKITTETSGDNENGSTENTKDLLLPEITLNETKENKETNNETDKYLGRDRTNATSTAELPVSPDNKSTDGLTMKVDYTLISTDGSGETITVTGAEVKIPAQYTNWEANYIYKYIFKITADNNGSTGGSSTGLTPIVFDAVVKENQTNSQITETEFKDGEGTTKDITNEGSTNEGN